MTLRDYAAEPPEGERAPRCWGHPDEQPVYVAIGGLDLTDGEAPITLRGWACPRCWTPRGVRLQEAT